MKKQLTLCMVCKDDKVLLGMKKRGFGAGRWNGFGGKVEENESIEQAARRELSEEAGIIAKDMVHMGTLDFSFESDMKELEVHIFRVTEYDGDPAETDEMRPQWFAKEELPYEQMWSADKAWIELLLQGKVFKGAIRFDKPSTAEYAAKIISQDIAIL